MKIRLVGAELFRTDERKDGQIDKMKLIVAFRSFAIAPKIEMLKWFKAKLIGRDVVTEVNLAAER